MRRMGYGRFTTLVVLVVIVIKCSIAAATVPEEEEQRHFNTVKIEGYVYCTKSNNIKHTTLVADATPLTGAVVSLNCSRLNQTGLFQNTTTKENGYFSILLSPKQYSVVEECKVYVIKSPDENCNIPTNLNGGRTGASVLQLINNNNDRRSRDVVEKIRVGPFAFGWKKNSSYYHLKTKELAGVCDSNCVFCSSGCCNCIFDSNNNCVCLRN